MTYSIAGQLIDIHQTNLLWNDAVITERFYACEIEFVYVTCAVLLVEYVQLSLAGGKVPDRTRVRTGFWIIRGKSFESNFKKSGND